MDELFVNLLNVVLLPDYIAFTIRDDSVMR